MRKKGGAGIIIAVIIGILVVGGGVSYFVFSGEEKTSGGENVGSSSSPIESSSSGEDLQADSVKELESVSSEPEEIEFDDFKIIVPDGLEAGPVQNNGQPLYADDYFIVVSTVPNNVEYSMLSGGHDMAVSAFQSSFEKKGTNVFCSEDKSASTWFSGEMVLSCKFTSGGKVTKMTMLLNVVGSSLKTIDIYTIFVTSKSSSLSSNAESTFDDFVKNNIIFE